jgi:hypothetical protein
VENQIYGGTAEHGPSVEPQAVWLVYCELRLNLRHRTKKRAPALEVQLREVSLRQNGVELWSLGMTGSTVGGERSPGDRSKQVVAYVIYPAYAGAGDNLAGPAYSAVST